MVAAFADAKKKLKKRKYVITQTDQDQGQIRKCIHEISRENHYLEILF